MADIEHLLLVASVLLLLAVLAGRASARAGVPPLLLFLAIGMLAGSDGLGGIYFNDPWLAQLVGTIALAFILFAAGLETDWSMVRPAVWSGLALSTIGVLLTAALVAWFATLLLHFSWVEGLLLGAIVSATDAAAVFSVMRMGSARLPHRLLSVLELESGTNDPMAVFLTIGMTQLLTDPHASILQVVVLFVEQMGLGVLLGLGLGIGAIRLIRWLGLEQSALYPVFTIALVLFVFGVTASLHGSGFLAVYVAGLARGNVRPQSQANVALFHGGIASLMEIAMFLTLGLLVFPSHLVLVAGPAVLMTLFLIVVARPVSVFASLLVSGIGVREKAFISWVGLRGAVPIVLATFPLLAGVPRADLMFDIVFFIVLASVLVQGTTIPLVARWLGVAAAPESDEAAAEPETVTDAT